MAELDGWMRFATNYGIGAVVVLFVGWLIRAIILWVGKQFDTYVPPAIQAHLELMSTLTDTQRQLSDNQRQLTENSNILTESMMETKNGASHCKTTTNALLGFCDTFEHAAEGHAKADKIKQSISSVRSTLMTGSGH
jgi:uncharacterized phage infection (PIP) family protein YhgE